ARRTGEMRAVARLKTRATDVGRGFSRVGRLSRAVAIALVAGACATNPRPAPSALPGSPALPAPPAQRSFAELQRDLDAILAAPALQRGFWGVLIKSLKTGETLYAVNARKLMMPASSMKIVTLAAAAARLGWDYTYETRVVAAGTIEGDTLNGDLVIV